MATITLDNIHKIVRHKYFRVDDEEHKDDKKHNEILNEVCYRSLVKLMIAAMKCNNGAYEFLMLVRNNDFEYAITTDYSSMTVGYSERMLNELRRGLDCTYLAFHNHTDETSFSILDILAFLENKRLTVLFVISNNCRYIEVVLKGNKHLKIQQLIAKLLNFLTNKVGILSKHASAKMLIEILEHLDITYLQYYNY